MTDLAAIAIALVTAAAAAAGPLPQWGILLVALLFGTVDSFKIASAQAYTYDLVGPLLATSGIAIAAIGIKLMSAAGNLAAGPVMDTYGAAVAFLVVAATSALSATVLLLGAPSAEVHRRRTESAPAGPPLTVRGSLVLVRRNHVLALLALAVIVTEIFGFSFLVLMPVFADQVFDTDAAGYGLMGAVVRPRRGGRPGGRRDLRHPAHPRQRPADRERRLRRLADRIGPLADAGDRPGADLRRRWHGGRQRLAVPIAHAALDARYERGAAMGVWTFGVGCGPIGSLAVGISAASIGAPLTQAVSGAVLLVLAIGLSFNRALRTLR